MTRSWLSASLLVSAVLVATPALAQPAAPADDTGEDAAAPDAEQPPAPEATAAPMPVAAPGAMPTAPMTAMPMTPPAAPPAPVVAGSDDANSGRAWLMPTALTAPAGTWSFTDYELLLVGGSYAFTDDFSLAAGTLVPIDTDQPFVGTLNGKLRIIHTPRTHVAVQAGALVVADGDESFAAGNAGAVATFCGDDVCSSHGSLYVGAAFAQDATETPLVVSGELTARFGRRVKGVVELDYGRVSGGGHSEDGLLAWYGLRFHTAEIGVDVGFAKPISEDTNGEFPIGLPWVNIQYRGLP